MKLSIFILSLVFSFSSSIADEYKAVTIKTIKVTDTIYMLMGKGGNIGLSVGSDGLFMIDDQFAPLNEKIRQAIKKISDQPIKYLINTHWHFDHVDGNEKMAHTGTIIVAHENVRLRMNHDQFITFFNKKINAYNKKALPVITFTKDINFYFNGDNIHIFHVDNAHTDSDAIVYFKNSNVLHTGDLYFSFMYPFIDTSSHGNIDGVIKSIQNILPMLNDKTKIIPGHGVLSNKKELITYLHMLEDIRGKVKLLLVQGKSLQAIQQAQITKMYDEKWGNGFLSSEKFIQIVVDSLK